jgi:uncharacterized protein (DUF433 family)
MGRVKTPKPELVREMVGGEPYEYYPLGKYVVVAPGVCGGRPTFKYSRLEVSFILDLLAAGRTVEEVVHSYALSKLTPEAVQEAITLAANAFRQTTKKLQPVAV